LNIDVGLIQMDIKQGDKETNLSVAKKLVNGISNEVDFVCLPEYFTTGSTPSQFNVLAEEIPGDTTNILGEIASENNIYIVGSIIEKDGGNHYNTGVLVGPDGELKTKYRKLHLFMDERSTIQAGDQPPEVVETEFGRVGLIVCYDAVFPELSRKLLERHADLVFIPSNWPDPYTQAWKVATSARALDNQFWTIAVNRVGNTQKHTYSGKSRVTNPYGQTTIQLKNKQEARTTQIDLKKTREFKSQVNFKKDLNIQNKEN